VVTCIQPGLILASSLFTARHSQLFQYPRVNAARAAAANLQVITQSSANLVLAVRSSRDSANAQENTVVGLAAGSDRSAATGVEATLKLRTLSSTLALPGSPAVRFRTPSLDFGQTLC
jgi:hypothetical protein